MALKLRRRAEVFTIAILLHRISARPPNPVMTGADSFKRWLGGNSILTLNQAAGKMASGDMFEGDVARLKLRGDIGRSPCHLFHYCSGRSSSDRTTTEHENGLLAVSPPAEAEDCFEGFPTDD